MSEKVYIEIDASSWMDTEGVLTSVWFGDACEPCFEYRETYEQLIDKELESHTIRGRLQGEHIDRAEQFVKALIQASMYARKRLEELSD